MDHNLSLRLIGEDDFSVMREGRAIGRIRLDDERPGQEAWNWSITVPLPVQSWCAGRAPSMEAAKVAFRSAWVQFFDRLTPRDIEHGHRHQDSALERCQDIHPS